MAERTLEELREDHYQDRAKYAAKRLAEMLMDPSRPCPYCKERPYPVVVVQHCWCDPEDEEKLLRKEETPPEDFGGVTPMGTGL